MLIKIWHIPSYPSSVRHAPWFGYVMTPTEYVNYHINTLSKPGKRKTSNACHGLQTIQFKLKTNIVLG